VELTSLEQEINADRESWLERTNLHLGKDYIEGQQRDNYVEAHDPSLLGEKQGVPS